MRAVPLPTLVLACAVAAAAACVLPPVEVGGRACDDAHPCAGGFTCVAGGCERVCASSSQCPDGRVCVDGACLAPTPDDAGPPFDAGEPEPDAGAPEPDAGPADSGVDAGPNFAPTLAPSSATTAADRAVTVVLAATDADGDELTALVTRAAAHGAAAPGTGAAVIYTPEPGFAGRDTFVVVVSDGAAQSDEVEVQVDVAGRSCAHVATTGGAVGDGRYTLDLTPDNGTDDFTLEHCDMTTRGGGFTLALKIDGAATTFCYDAPIWVDDTTLEPDSTDPRDPTEAKLRPYAALPAHEALLVFDEKNDGLGVLTSLVVPLDPSLQGLGLTLREHLATNARLESAITADEWDGLFPARASALSFGTEGFNVVRSVNSAARIGLMGSSGFTSSAGVGMRGTGCAVDDDVVVAGLYSTVCCSGNVIVPVLANVLVRSRDFTFLPASPSCAAHLQAGRSLSGSYLVDLDGLGGAPAAPQSCDLGDFRRLVVWDAAVDACPDGLVDNPTGPGCVRPGAAGGAVSLLFPSLAPFTTVKGVIEGLGTGTPDAFSPSGAGITLDNVYVDGVSVTVNAVRRHVTTFAVGSSDPTSQCPCPGGASAPAFAPVHACDTATGAPPWGEDDPAWDDDALEEDCTPTETPSAFEAVVAGGPHAGPVEVRIMTDEPTAEEDIAILRLELYVR